MVWQLVGRDPGRPLAQTSRPELPASDPRQTRSLEWPPEAQTTGATDTRAPEAQSRGRSQTLFYNEIKTHRALNKDAPRSRAVRQVGIIKSHAILGGLHHQYVRI